MTEKNDSLSFLQENPWKNNENPIWIASTLQLYRNVSKYLFPGKLESGKQAQLLTLLQKVVLETPLLNKPQAYSAKGMTPVEKQFLFEHFLSTEGFQEAHGNEGFIVDLSGQFLLTINLKDHLHIQVTDCKGELENAWNHLVKIETEIGKSIDYAFSSRFGFLTAHTYHCGTGFVARTLVHVPALVHTDTLKAVLDKELEEDVASSGMQGDQAEFIGDIVSLYNNVTLGVSEEDILKAVRASSTKLMVAEKSARSQLKAQNASTIKNKVSRAYGLIIHSYQLETQEALNALSLCKLAIDIGWLEGIDHKKLNELLFTTRRGHLSLDTKIEQEDITKKRAELLHAAFKGTTLLV